MTHSKTTIHAKNVRLNKQTVTFRARKATYTLQILESLICYLPASFGAVLQSDWQR